MPKNFSFSSSSSMIAALDEADDKKVHAVDDFDDINHLAYTLVNKMKKVSVCVRFMTLFDTI